MASSNKLIADEVEKMRRLFKKYVPDGHQFVETAIQFELPVSAPQNASYAGVIKGGVGLKMTYSYGGVEMSYHGRVTMNIDDVDFFINRRVVVNGSVIVSEFKANYIFITP